MNIITLNRVLLNNTPLNYRRKRILTEKDFYFKTIERTFTFSKSAGGKSIKDGRAYIKRIKGNSVVWNQKLIRDNETAQGITTTWADNIATLSGIATSSYAEITDSRVPIFNGHKYLVEGWVVSNPNSLSFGLGLFNNVSGQLQFDSSTVHKAEVFTCNGYYRSGFGVDNFGGAGTDLTGLQLEARVIDLTQLFQAGNEPTTIEDFNARVATLGVDLNAYNEGEVIHCNTESIKSVGDNAWDEEWEVGAINTTTGENSSTQGSIRAINYIDIIGGAQYYCTNTGKDALDNYYVWALFYDQDKKLILNPYGRGQNYEAFNNKTLQLPSNARYMRFYLSRATTYNNDIMISLVHSGWKQDTDAGYQPYWQDTLPLPIIRKYFPQGMKSAGTAHDEIRYNKASGKWEYSEGRIKSVDMGTLKWSKGNGDNYVNSFYAQNALANKANGHNILCSRYVTNTKEGWPSITDADKTINSHSGDDYKAAIWIHDSSYTDAATLKADLQGVILYYESNDWEWVELDTEDQNFRDYYNVADFGTEEAIPATDAEGNIIPSANFSADIIYQFNAVDMIREHELEITELQKVIATMQAQLTALTNGGQ